MAATAKVKLFKSVKLTTADGVDSIETLVNVFLSTIAIADFIDARFLASDQGWNLAYVIYKG